MNGSRIFPGIATHAWNADCSQIAVCPNNNEIHIYKTNSSPDTDQWELLQVLKEHLNIVTSLDWNR